jgi:hypothetical protein
MRTVVAEGPGAGPSLAPDALGAAGAFAAGGWAALAGGGASTATAKQGMARARATSKWTRAREISFDRMELGHRASCVPPFGTSGNSQPLETTTDLCEVPVASAQVMRNTAARPELLREPENVTVH